jgi:general nucleoside transport system ATP-binding protein
VSAASSPALDVGHDGGHGGGPAGPVAVVEMRGIGKEFGSLRALHHVDLTLQRGRVHALIGENGAGKSTLMNVLTGTYRADAGHVAFAGDTTELRSPRDAAELGVGMVHQHFELIGAFTGLENIALAVQKDAVLRSRVAVRPLVADLMARYGLSVDLDRRVSDLEVGDQQKVELLRVLAQGTRVLLLDEPTTHLTPAEVDRLFSAVRGLASDGVAVVLISHKVREILAIADDITVLRKGERVAMLTSDEATADSLVRLVMGVAAATAGDRTAAGAVVGVPVTDPLPTPDVSTAVDHAPTGDDDGVRPPALSLAGVTTSAGRGEVALDIAALHVDAGEVVGVAAVAGNGQRDIVETIAGLRRPRTGSIMLAGRDVTRRSVASRIRHGLAVLPGDRMREGILPASPLYESFALGLHHFVPRRRWRRAAARAQAREAIEQFSVATGSEMTRTANLSGGNVQKVLLARALRIAGHADVELLVAMNPTNGLDVGAARFVYGRLDELRARGGAVLLLSEDLDELMERCDRIVVLDRGRVTGTLGRPDFDRRRIGDLMVGSDG